MNPNTPLLSQENFPLLFKVFQWTIGGTIDKRKLALLNFSGQKEVLEIGCSIGNVAKVFSQFGKVNYTGLDIDPSAIRFAQRDFRGEQRFKFICQDLNVFATETKQKFDYILFAGVAHHVEDAALSQMLTSARKLLSDGGVLMVIDPVQPKPEDGRFIHWYQKLERGQYVRQFEDLKSLILGIPDLKLDQSEECVIGATPLSVPPSCRFGIFTTSKA